MDVLRNKLHPGFDLGDLIPVPTVSGADSGFGPAWIKFRDSKR
jgi:hypothetical protein